MAEVGKPKMEVPVYEPPAEIAAEIEAYGADKLKEALMDANKLEREENVAKVKAEIAEVFIEKYPDNAKRRSLHHAKAGEKDRSPYYFR